MLPSLEPNSGEATEVRGRLLDPSTKNNGRNGWKDELTEPQCEREEGSGKKKPCPMTGGVMGSSCLIGPFILWPTLPWEDYCSSLHNGLVRKHTTSPVIAPAPVTAG